MYPVVFGADPGGQSGLRALLGLWPLWLPLVAGGAAIFWLLPRPRPNPLWWGAVAGAAALLLGGALLVRAEVFTPEVLLFYAFSAVALISGALLVTQRNPARAALSFTLVVLSTCGIFLLLAAPFLMAATIIIYAGAIVVTFLFVLMLAQQEGLSDADARSREPLLASITGFVLMGALLYVLRGAYTDRDLRDLIQRTRAVRAQTKAEDMHKALVGQGEKGEVTGGLYADYQAALNRRGQKELAHRVQRVQTEALPLSTGPDAPLEEWRKVLARLEEIGQEALSMEREGRPIFLTPRAGRPAPGAKAEGPTPPSPLSNLSGPPASLPREQMRRDDKTGLPQLPADNSGYLGRSLFTDYLLPVEIAGMLLLVAAVGAIAIAHRRGPGRPA
jgi:NADH:ubiquinone oxidoreductase subunit 6 (subunit J)